MWMGVQNLQEALLLQRDRATRLSVEILQLQDIPFKNESRAYRVALFSRFHTIPECDRHTHIDRQTDGQIHDDSMYRA